MFDDFKAKAQQGIQQREDVINKFRKKKAELDKEVEELKGQVGQSVMNKEVIHRELERLKKGEELFKKQFSEF